jgi:hypothetical protein
MIIFLLFSKKNNPEDEAIMWCNREEAGTRLAVSRWQ